MNTLTRHLGPDGPLWAYTREGETWRLDHTLDDLLRLGLDDMRSVCESAKRRLDDRGALLAPVESQDVWGAGVTYRRSREGRNEESRHSGVYDAVFDAERPELFFKAAGAWVVGDGDDVGVRGDSSWDVPEPEVALVLNAAGAVAGFTIADDVTSRAIEGENPLYLPQAKIFRRSCALGPAIVPIWDRDGDSLDLTLTVHRGDGIACRGETSTSQMHRGFDDLAGWLFREMDFPDGVVLMSGTGIVPEPGFTLRPGDRIDIDVSGLGRLSTGVRPSCSRESA